MSSGPVAAVQSGAIVVQSGGVVVQGGDVVQGGRGVQGAAPFSVPRDTRPQTGTGQVRGRVTSDTGQPLRHIRVQLGGAPAPHFTTTDSDGRYEFTDLPAGHFIVTASHVGYVASRSDAFDLADGQRADSINLRLAHGGVIAGQVVDEFGDPVIGATVSPLRQQFASGQRRLINAGQTTTTNDIGEYRVFGLAPGQYFVTVMPRNEQLNSAPPGTGPVVQGPSVGYAPTYYPGTPDAAAAQPIAVAAAQTVTNISFSLSPTRLARISGIALDDQGRPVTRGGATLIPRGSAAVGGAPASGGPMRPDGTFVLNNVPPGNYYVRVTIPPPPAAGPPARGVPPPRPTFAMAPVTVAGDDVNGLVLTPIRPATIRGRIVFDDAAAAGGIEPASVRVIAQRIDSFSPPLMTGAPPTVTVHDDFTFELTASPERSTIRVVVAPPPGSRQAAPPVTAPQAPVWRVKAIRSGAADVIDSGIDLSPGQEVGDVEIDLTRTAQTLAGSVTTSGGSPVSGALVIVFAQDRNLWAAASGRYTGRAVAGEDGTFKVTTLPPGAYYALAVHQAGQVIPTDWADPDVLEAAVRVARGVSLAEGQTTNVDLRVSP